MTRGVTTAARGFTLGTNKAWARFERETPPRVSKQPLVSPGLGAAHGVTFAAAPEGTTGGDQLFGVALRGVKEKRGGNAQMLQWS